MRRRFEPAASEVKQPAAAVRTCPQRGQIASRHAPPLASFSPRPCNLSPPLAPESCESTGAPAAVRVCATPIGRGLVDGARGHGSAEDQLRGHQGLTAGRTHQPHGHARERCVPLRTPLGGIYILLWNHPPCGTSCELAR